jgi:hypothetical protein
MSIYDKNLGFIEQNMHFRTLQRGSNKKSLLIDTIFTTKLFSYYFFRAALYRLMLVLHKDLLFHWNLAYSKECYVLNI